MTAVDDELLRAIIDSAADFAIMTTDRSGTVMSWNSGAQRLLGWDEKEIIGCNSRIFFTAEDRAAAKPEQEMEVALAKGRAEDERWHVRKDGSCFWGSGVLTPLHDGQPGFVKILRDRTEEHRAKQELQETIERLRFSEERFRILATNIPQLVFRSLGNGSRTWGSPQWEVYSGLSDANSRAFQWLDAVHPEDRPATLKEWERARQTGEYYIEHRIRRQSDGAYRWHQTRAVPVPDGDRGGDWVGTSADIHDLRTLRDRQEVILAEIQHRTRNLLALVQATARQTLRRSSSLQDFGREFDGRLRALSRVQSLLGRTAEESLDVATLVELELAVTRDRDDTRVTVQGEAVRVPASSAQTLALALHELATNAVKYGAFAQSTGRLSVTWWEENKGDLKGPQLVLDWTESGVTMPRLQDPPKKGYGRELIERALRYQLGADTEFHLGPDGVRCRIAVPVAGKYSQEHAAGDEGPATNA